MFIVEVVNTEADCSWTRIFLNQEKAYEYLNQMLEAGNSTAFSVI